MFSAFQSEPRRGEGRFFVSLSPTRVKAPLQVDMRPPLQVREDLAEEVTIDLGSSINLRRTALRLVDLSEPRLVDWDVEVVPDGRIGEIVMLGDAEPSADVV